MALTNKVPKDFRQRCRIRPVPFDALVKANNSPHQTKENNPMRVMVIVKASTDSEAGVMPTEAELTEMGAYNEALVKAGIMVDGDGLKGSSHGFRVQFSGGERSVVDGPFLEVSQLLAGFWIWQVSSIEEAKRVGAEVPEAPSRRRRARNPAVHRGRGLRRRLHARDAREGRRAARDRGRAPGVINPEEPFLGSRRRVRRGGFLVPRPTAAGAPRSRLRACATSAGRLRRRGSRSTQSGRCARRRSPRGRARGL